MKKQKFRRILALWVSIIMILSSFDTNLLVGYSLEDNQLNEEQESSNIQTDDNNNQNAETSNATNSDKNNNQPEDNKDLPKIDSNSLVDLDINNIIGNNENNSNKYQVEEDDYSYSCLDFYSSKPFKISIITEGGIGYDRSWDGSVTYSTNKSSWRPYGTYGQPTEIAAATGADGKYHLYFRGEDNRWFSNQYNGMYSYFVLDGTDISCDGNIMSLVNYMPEDHIFCDENITGYCVDSRYSYTDPDVYINGIKQERSYVKDTTYNGTSYYAYTAGNDSPVYYLEYIPEYAEDYLTVYVNEKRMSETLFSSDYYGRRCTGNFAYLFQDCTELIKAPDLPAQTLNDACYANMFKGCSKLKKGPELIATTLSTSCYYNMFEGCSSLTKVPEIDGEILAENCYAYMFKDCTSLKRLPVLTAYNTPDGCYSHMFDGCTNIKLNSVRKDPSDQEWKLEHCSGSWGRSCADDMLANTGGEFTGTPEEGVTYYYQQESGDYIEFRSKEPFSFGCSKLSSTAVLNYTFDFEEWTKYKLSSGMIDAEYSEDDDLYHIYVRGNLTTSSFIIDNTEITTFKLESPTDTLIDARGKLSALSLIKESEGLLPMGAFKYLFEDAVLLRSAPSLFYDNMSKSCYEGMFKGCTNLVDAPLLNSLALAASCYKKMFEGCTSLISIPDLNAMTMKDECYSEMFKGCTSLSVLPELRSDFLADKCYYHMFENCTSVELTTRGSSDLAKWSLPKNRNSITTFAEGMFEGTGGEFTGSPKLLTDYYYSVMTPYLDFSCEGYNQIGLYLAKTISPGYHVYDAVYNGIIEYSTDRSTWNLYTGFNTSDNSYGGEVIEAEYNSNDNRSHIYLRGKGNTVFHGISFGLSDYYGYSFNNISCTGNIMALLDYEKMPEEMPDNATFYNLFYGCDYLIKAPELTAKVLKPNCYGHMFEGCTYLTKSAVMKAETMADSCCEEMYKGCTSLSSAASLPATVMAESCYKSMFEGCTSLNKCPELPADTLAPNCYYSMYKNCSSLTVSPQLPAKEMKYASYMQMFYNCENMKIMANLPATTLASNCYKQMYKECHNVYVTTIKNDEYTETWMIPAEATGGDSSFSEEMLESTGGYGTYGSFTGDPQIGVEYYYHSGYAAPFNLNSPTPFKAGFKECNWIAPLYSNEYPIMEYSTDGKIWSKYLDSMEGTMIDAEQSSDGLYYVYFRGTNIGSLSDVYHNSWDSSEDMSQYATTTFEMDGQNISCGGQLLSLLNYTELPQDAMSMGQLTFANLFKGCTELIKTPALTSNFVQAYGYYHMFEGCTSLTELPMLEAQDVQANAYDSMFKDCTGLTEVGDIFGDKSNSFVFNHMFEGCTSISSVSSLAHIEPGYGAFAYMFEGCTSLTSVPDLPQQQNYYYGGVIPMPSAMLKGTFKDCTGITTAPLIKFEKLGEESCAYMYEGCTKLTTIEEFNINEVSKGSMKGMFKNCKSLEEPPKLSLLSLADDCYMEMFRGCISLLDVPKLPALIVPTRAYSHMFYGCSSLEYLPKLYATQVYSYAYEYMFADCPKIAISDKETEDFQIPWSFPNDMMHLRSSDIYYNTGYGPQMIAGTGGPFTSTPELRKTYYQKGKTGLDLSSSSEFTLKFSKIAWNGTMEYSLNALRWIEYTQANTVINSEIGDDNLYHIYLRGIGNTHLATSETNYTQLEIDGNSVSCNGHITKLLNNSITGEIVDDYAFANLFKNCSALISTPSLGTYKLSKYCYYGMFNGCDNLTQSDELVAENLSVGCYESMFEGCHSLTDAPVINATSMADNSCRNMFKDCINLGSAPSLGANSLSENCYYGMFSGCSNLIELPNLPAKRLASGCYQEMFKSCTSLTDMIKLNATTLASNCYKNMFEGCSSLSILPSLDSVALVDGCYDGMFSNCSSVKVSEIRTSEYRIPWKIPNEATGSNSFDNLMFDLTGGTFTGNPVIGKTYYLTGSTGLEFVSSSMFNVSMSAKHWNGTLEYSTNNKDWTVYDSTETVINSVLGSDSKYHIYFSGYDNTHFATSLDEVSSFVVNGFDVSVKGDISEIIGSDGLDDLVLDDYAFAKLFKDCTSIVSAPTLGFDKLSPYIYASMFENCTNLVLSPELTSTTLATGCYQNMFNGCTNMISMPDLPATNLANDCYKSMFKDCTDMINLSELSSTNLAQGCYSYMFEGCSSINETPVLPSLTLASNCYEGMFKDCSSLSQVPQLSSINLAEKCYADMFKGCTNIVEPMLLPADTLFNKCYYGMFDGCSKLRTTPKLMALELADYCYANMFNGCTSLTILPSLSSIKLKPGCYDGMFSNCTSIKLSAVPTDTFQKPWSIPREAIGTGFDNGMLTGTTGTFTSDPIIGTTYYQYGKMGLDFSSENAFSISLSNKCWDGEIDYSLDDDIWETYTDDLPIVMSAIGNDGLHHIYFRGMGNTYLATGINEGDYSSFIINGVDVSCSGNLNVMLDFDNAPSELSSDNTFAYLFKDCDALVSAPKLPATTLSPACYYGLFSGCTNIVETPELLCTTLEDDCYANMFKGCEKLTNVCDLPAESLTNSCYLSMFENCSSLVNAPSISAESLNIMSCASMFKGCTELINSPEFKPTSVNISSCQFMFMNCTKLKNAPQLPSESVSDNTYLSMFNNCTSLEKAPELPATTVGSRSYDSMFANCLSLTETPELPCTSLANACYSKMFYNCSGLTKLPNLNAIDLTDNCYEMMFYGCSQIKVSKVKNSLYNIPWKFPDNAHGSNFDTNMLMGTTGPFTDNPQLGITYYLAGKDGFEFVSDSQFSIKLSAKNWNGKLEYCINGQDWITYNVANTVVEAELGTDNKYHIQFRGTDNTHFATALDKVSTFVVSGEAVKCQGNILNLLDYENSEEAAYDNYCFAKLFSGCSALISTPELPANSLKTSMYTSMFENCSNITSTPALTATTLAKDCYKSMFKGCTSLTMLPNLSATNLPSGCYASMFEGCSQIRLSTIKDDDYQIPWSIPSNATGTTFDENMLKGTSGLFTGNPVIGVVYYQYGNDKLDFSSNSSFDISFDSIGWNGKIEYSVNGNDWVEYTTKNDLVSSTKLSDGNYHIYLRGYNNDYLANDQYEDTYTHLKINGTNVNCIGSVMSLLSYDRYIGSIDNELCFYRLFKNCAALIAAPNLSAHTISAYCYQEMFSGCKNLIKAPALPAKALEDYCYNNMFSDCLKLETPSVMDAVTTAPYSCMGMYQNCVHLAKVPELLPTTLAKSCYANMFTDCISLRTLPHLDATVLGVDCYRNMFAGCTKIKVSETRDSEYTLPWTIPEEAIGANFDRDMLISTGGSFMGNPLIGRTYYLYGSYGLEFSSDNSFSIKMSAHKWNGTLEYSLDAERWFVYNSTSDTVTAQKDDNNKYYIYFRGTGNTHFATSENDISSFVIEGNNVNCTGELPDLLDYNKQDVVVDDYAFAGLFKNNTALISSPDLMLKSLSKGIYYSLYENCSNLTTVDNLEATTLTDSCYQNMFAGCTNLVDLPSISANAVAANSCKAMFKGCESITDIPKLLATNTATGCYMEMFSGCSKLQNTVDLPADVLSQDCYRAMFKDCVILEETPDLVATTLANGCYYDMFAGCTNLNLACDLDATDLATQCYKGMFNGCINLEKAPNIKATSVSEESCDSMFKDCKSLTLMPTLDATILGPKCYKDMFNGCEKLVKLSKLPANNLEEYCYSNMFNGCTSLNKLPILNAINLAKGCYENMFSNCTSIKLSAVKTNEYQIPWSIPAEAVGTDFDHNMILNTSGPFKADPVKGVVYYQFGSVGLDFSSNSSFEMGLTDVTWDGTIEYSNDGCNWYEYTDNNIMASSDIGDDDKHHVYFRGENNAFMSLSSDPHNYCSFRFSGENISCVGNVMLLLDHEYPSYELKSNYAFYKLFNGCTNLVKAPSLLATKLSANCYQAMFSGCTNLEEAPELPAPITTPNCYENMFSHCTKLTKTPELNSTIIAPCCYKEMFAGCTNLETSTTLPGEIMAVNCYQGMFKDCISLKVAPKLDSLSLGNNCYMEMFSGCSEIEKTPDLKSTKLAVSCYNSMFKDCIKLTEATSLPATELTDNCYTSMFSGCELLEEYPDLVADTTAINCYAHMFEDCISIKKLPKLKSKDLKENCYDSMFKGCTNIKVSDVKNSEYAVPWRLPFDSVGTNFDDAMLDGTSGPFTGAPLIGKTYYLLGTLGIEFNSDSPFEIGFSKRAWDKKIEYSLDSEEWLEYKPTTGLIKAENPDDTMYRIYFRGSGNTYLSESVDNHSQFNIKGQDVSCVGDIMSLLDYESENNTTISTNYAFAGLFKDCDAIVGLPDMTPTTLSKGCYENMYSGCNSLQELPQLPATVLADDCYKNMFKASKGLVISEIKLSDNSKEWSMPNSNTSSLTDWNADMFCDTSGPFKDNPIVNKIYYYEVATNDYQIVDSNTGKATGINTEAYDVDKDGNPNYVIRKAFALDIKDIYDYFGKRVITTEELNDLYNGKSDNNSITRLCSANTNINTNTWITSSTYNLDVEDIESLRYVRPAFTLDLSKISSKPRIVNAARGDIIYLDIIKGYKEALPFRVLKNENSKALLLSMTDINMNVFNYDSSLSIFSDGGMYQQYVDSTLDYYLNNTFANSKLNDIAKSALVDSKILQFAYSLDQSNDIPEKVFKVTFKAGDGGKDATIYVDRANPIITKNDARLVPVKSPVGKIINKWSLNNFDEKQVEYDFKNAISKDEVFYAMYGTLKISKDMLYSSASKNSSVDSNLKKATNIEYETDFNEDILRELDWNIQILDPNTSQYIDEENKEIADVKYNDETFNAQLIGISTGRRFVVVRYDGIELDRVPVHVLFNDTTTRMETDTFKSIYWASENNMVLGYENGSMFKPVDTATRQNFAVILWRHAGKPKPKTTRMTFPDCNNYADTSDSYNAILWASENRIVLGYQQTGKPSVYKPTRKISRIEMAIMLYRYAGYCGLSKSVSASAKPYKDTKGFPKSSDRYKSTLWVSEKGVAKGYEDGNYGVNDPLQRQQLVIMLYRFNNLL